MQSDNRFFDDAAKLAGGAIGTLAGLRREIETLARQQVERLLERMDLVTRDEFEAVKEMAAKARDRAGRCRREACGAGGQGGAQDARQGSEAEIQAWTPATPKS